MSWRARGALPSGLTEDTALETPEPRREASPKFRDTRQTDNEPLGIRPTGGLPRRAGARRWPRAAHKGPPFGDTSCPARACGRASVSHPRQRHVRGPSPAALPAPVHRGSVHLRG